MVDDVQSGYSLVIPRDAVLHIPNALIALLDVHEQNTISKCGEIIDKKQLTHNQSMTYNRGSGTSDNCQVLWEELHEYRYGYYLLCIIHAIACLRQHHPWSCILLDKYNFKSEYWRLHYHWQTAI